MAQQLPLEKEGQEIPVKFSRIAGTSEVSTKLSPPYAGMPKPLLGSLDEYTQWRQGTGCGLKV